MSNRYCLIVTLLIFSFAAGIAQEKTLPLTGKGFIPVWIVAGPFEQPLVGFGTPADKDVIGEKEIQPFVGKVEKDSLVKEGTTKWIAQSAGSNGFVDLNSSLRWFNPGKSPDMIWYSIAGYAAAYVESPVEQKVMLFYGSNSYGKIYVNGEEVFSLQNSRNAVPDENKIPVTLKKGKNLLLVKVGNSHTNHQLAFFEMIKWEWGFYLKLLKNDGSPLENVTVNLPELNVMPGIDVVSTFFFKKSGNVLKQRFDVVINSPVTETAKGQLKITAGGKEYREELEDIPFGYSRHEIYIPELAKDVKASVSLNFGNESLKKEVTLLKQPHYELYMMMLSHTDIGYTHPQPVVKEVHSGNLDDVVKMCEEYPDFKWTIETLWQLEQYEQSRTPEQYQKLVKLIKEGRVALSPLYSNPFTGWAGEEEMIRGLAPAIKYKKEFGIKYNAAVYNDVPGQSWILPQVLNNAGVEFVAEGLNEIFNDYSFQRSLPKAFIWEGADSSRVVTYLNAAYNEGKHYGLEKRGNYAVQQRMWERINKLRADGFDYEMILLNSAFGDNSTIPVDQYHSMMEWNKEFEYPKFISSHVSEFAEKFIKKYKSSLPVVRGDWTSNWDIYYQGEPDKMKKQRWVQHNLLSAEKLAVLTSMKDNKMSSLDDITEEAYRSLLNFSGHGSGIEYGYASPADNMITVDFREKYVHDAYMNTEEILMRSMYRTGKPEETFEGEGIIIFNTLSWERNAPVEVQFTAQTTQQYEVIDIATKEKVSSFRDGYKLYFVAKGLPSFGYKKYRLQPVDTPVKDAGTGLAAGSNSVENKYYKIEFNKDNGSVVSITDKKAGQQITDSKSLYAFAAPLIEKFQLKENYRELDLPGIVEIIDESPVRIIVNIKRKGSLFENTSFILWNDLDRVDLDYTINMRALKTTEHLEEYGISFPFAVDRQNELVEIAGGYLDPDKDKMPGSGNDGYSIRRSVALFNDNNSISWSSADGRVIRLRVSENGNKTLISNPVNNFPLGWNRNELNNQTINFRYSFTSQEGGFNASFTSRFGWEINTPALVRRSWYRSEPATQSFMSINNSNIGLLTMLQGDSDDYFLLRLINFNNTTSEDAVITSELLSGITAANCNYLNENVHPVVAEGNTIKVSLKPNEISTIKIKRTNNQVMNQGK